MSTHDVHLRGLAAVEAMMRARGLDVRIRKAGRRRFLHVTAADGRAADLRAHALAKPAKGWQINDVNTLDAGVESGRATFRLLADMTTGPSDVAVWLVPHPAMARIARVAFDEWKAKHGGDRPQNRASPHVLIERERVAAWAGRLDLLPA